MTIPRSAGWLGCDAECDPTADDRGGPQHHARTRAGGGRRDLYGDRAAVSGAGEASARLSPPASCGSAVLSRHPHPPRHRCVVGVDIEASLAHHVSDTTLRARRDNWIKAGVFEQVRAQAEAAFDRIVGLDLSEVAIDATLHKVPYGGEGTGPNPRTGPNRAGSGPSVSIATTSRRPGRSTAPTATTWHVSSRPSMSSPLVVGSARATPCTSIAATTTPRSDSSSPTPGSSITSSNVAAGPMISGPDRVLPPRSVQHARRHRSPGDAAESGRRLRHGTISGISRSGSAVGDDLECPGLTGVCLAV